jgi:general secretion pathway protein C
MMLHDKINIFNNHMTRYYYTIVYIFAIAVIIYIGIDTFYRIVRTELIQVDTEEVDSRDISADKRSDKSRLTDYQTIVDRNIFSKLNGVPAKKGDINSEDLKATSMKIALLGTIAGNNRSSAAIIEDTVKRTQGLYREGDSIQDGVVKSILRGKVVLKIGDRDEVLTMEEPGSHVTGTASDISQAETVPVATPSAPAAIERNITIKRSDINESLKDLNGLISQASIQPHYTDGEADGLAVTGIKAGSIFRKMGLRNGDIVKGVNDNEIKSPEDLINMYNDLKSAPDISLQVMRRGRERSLNYSFTD